MSSTSNEEVQPLVSAAAGFLIATRAVRLSQNRNRVQVPADAWPREASQGFHFTGSAAISGRSQLFAAPAKRIEEAALRRSRSARKPARLLADQSRAAAVFLNTFRRSAAEARSASANATQWQTCLAEIATDRLALVHESGYVVSDGMNQDGYIDTHAAFTTLIAAKELLAIQPNYVALGMSLSGLVA